MSGSMPEHHHGHEEAERDLALGRAATALTVCALFTLPLLADTAQHWLGWRAFFLADAKIQLVLATLAHLWGGARFYAGTLRAPATLRGRLTAVAALAVGALYLYGVWAAFTHPEYAAIAFKVSATLLTLALLGRVILMGRLVDHGGHRT